jgi:protein phosphatase 1 regulatory subunit 10
MTNFRDLDKGEGAALHTAVFEEVLDWSDPQGASLGFVLVAPTQTVVALELDEMNDRPRGENSQEASTQAEREQTALSALYMSTAQIPESPAEPTTAALLEEEVDQNVAHMTVGEENDHVFWGEEMEYAAQQQSSAAAVAAAVAAGFSNTAGSANSAGNVALLIQQLAQGVNPLGAVLSNDMQQPQQQSSVPTSDQLAQLLNQLAGAGSGIAMQPQYGQASYGDDQSNPAGGWTATSNQFPADYGQGYDDPDHSRGWDGGRGGGRGRGRGRGGRGGGGGSGFRIKRKPCIFFAEGRRASKFVIIESKTETDTFAPPALNRCRNGDQCDFLHETGYTYS